MLGYVYLIMAVAFGFLVCSFAFPGLKNAADTTYRENEIGLSKYLILVPAWFTVGTIFMTWLCYLLACIFKNSRFPLLYANEVIMFAMIPVLTIGLYIIINREGRFLRGEHQKFTIPEIILFACVAVLFYLLFRMTFKVDHGQLYIGLSVFSDFTPHMSMIRSFSYGQNFPTQYSVCAGSDVRYHFMFEFLVGNLEFLGMRIDHAFNLPSFMSIMSMYSLLYVLACKITGKRLAGYLTCAFLTFRSSASLLIYMAGIPKADGVLKTMFKNLEFIGSTPNENWGLWNLNVYCNQRHFALGICVLLLLLIIYLPHLYRGFNRMIADGRGIKSWIYVSLIGREGWEITDLKVAIVSGLLLGALGFFNGAVLLATVIVLFFVAAASDNRFQFLIMAGIGGVLALIQTKVFIDGSTFSTSFRYGFLAENATIAGSVLYILRLLGILPILLLVVFAVSKQIRRYLMICFSALIVFAFNFSLTPDIAVNHKYIMIAVMLLDIFAAGFIVLLWSNKSNMMKVIAVILIICLTSTGLYETTVLMRRNNPKYSIVNNLDDELLVWLADNTSSKDLFLTANYYLTNSSTGSSFILSGVMLYDAWQYFGWSAGYDTGARDEVVKSIYSCTDAENLKRLIKKNNFAYVVIDSFNRDSQDYVVNEDLFDETFPVVYQNGSGHNLIKIYRTK